MKKFSVLPLEEKIDPSDLFSPMPERKRFGIKLDKRVKYVLLAVYAILMYIALLKNILVFVFGFGLLFLYAGLSKEGQVSKGTRDTQRTVENNIWNRLPFLLAGLFFTFSLGADFINKKLGIRLRDYKVLTTLTKGVILALIIGRIVFLIASLCAVASRKKHCTEQVHTEPEGSASGLGASFNFTSDGMPVFRYNYEGEDYRFIDHDNATAYLDLDDTFKNDLKLIDLHIDPNAPERYFSEIIFRRTGTKLKDFFITLAFILLFYYGIHHK